MEIFMKKLLVAIGAASLLLSGCANGLTPTGIGLVTDVQGPITATGETGVSKTGTACATSILGLVNQGDASINTAQRNGGISTISTVDYHTSGFYPFYGKTCVIVRGD